jgi:ureidoglycolate hydrolase
VDIVSGEVTSPGGNIEIYIQPHPIIRHMPFSQTMDALDDVRKSSVMNSEFFVEAVAYQQAAIEEMERRAFSVQAMHPMKDKRARLRVAARYHKDGYRQISASRMRAAFDAAIGVWRGKARRRRGRAGVFDIGIGRRGNLSSGSTLY